MCLELTEVSEHYELLCRKMYFVEKKITLGVSLPDFSAQLHCYIFIKIVVFALQVGYYL